VRALTLFFSLLVATLPTTAQFRTSAEGVMVDVLVTEGSRPLTGLTGEDFELYDSGVLQDVRAMSIQDIPLSLMLVLDSSSSLEGRRLTELKRGADDVIEQLRDGDRGAVLTFSDQLRLRAGWTEDRAVLKSAIASVETGGTTSLTDAVYAALTLNDRLPARRSLVLVFSDGNDTASWLAPAAVARAAANVDSVIYAVVFEAGTFSSNPSALRYRSGLEILPAPGLPVSPGDLLEHVTSISGGRLWITEDTSRLRGALTGVLAEFRTRYVLTYTPRGVPAPGWHPIEIKLKAGRGTVRARRGYHRP